MCSRVRFSGFNCKPAGQMDTQQLWQTIKREVEVNSAAEPVLASFFYNSVLNHPDFASALSHNLAEILGNSVVSPLTLRQLFGRQTALHPDIAESAARDVQAHFDRDPACDRYSLALLYFKGFRALQGYRLAHSLWQDGSRGIARYLQGRISEQFDVDIHPAARIGSAILVDHATGVVIGETAVIDDDVSILHAVTLGGTGNESGDRHPKVRRGVLIAVGAKILGNIVIGEGAKIAAGSLVLEDVPPHTTVAGVPAKVVGRPLEEAPALAMEHRISE